jgi:hypothetical protein
MEMAWLVNVAADEDGLIVASWGATLDLSLRSSPTASLDDVLSVRPAVILDGGKPS